MRGKPQAQPDFLTVVNLNQCVPADHPLRAIKRRVDAVLQKLSPLFDELYAEEGCPSVPPEQLLKARLLTALYSVRSDRLFCEQLGYNLLWLWFLDREFTEGSFDHSTFSKNYERVLSADVAKLFFAEAYDLSRQEGWTSDEHFTADGTLIESWASLKSFVRKDGGDAKKVAAAKDDDPGNPTIDFRGEKRRNGTHRSTTDPESVLYRKANGQEARLCFGAHLLMENRNGLCADFTLHNPITEPEPVMALKQLDEHQKLHQGVQAKSVGADKNYHRKDFVRECRQREIAPHVACKDQVRTPGVDRRTLLSAAYRASQVIRKRVEEIIGWIKVIGGLRRSRYRGIERTQAYGYFVAATYNLLRLARLELATVG
jgi:transposase